MSASDVATTNLLRELELARAESDRLFAIVRPDAIFERPIDARHRVIFYIGHLEGFDFIQICRENLGASSFDRTLDDLFQAGIDPDTAHLPSDKPSDWPSLECVLEYVDRCRKTVDFHLDHAPEEVVSMAIEHRLMHLETLAYMFHNFSYELKYDFDRQSPSVSGRQDHAKNAWRNIPPGEAILGKKLDNSFGWDNEYDEVRTFVPAFHIQQHSISNGEYLEFVEQGAAVPHFWVRKGGAFYYRGMFEELPLPLDWPVYVTQTQAQAYADWKGWQLPTEQQYHRAAYGTPSGENSRYPWGENAPDTQFGNFDFRRWDPEPVWATPDGDSSFGVSQLVGNGWEWTSTPFGPLPGFRPFATYPGYSANFFDGEHFVLKGGSARTAARLLRPSFRNWFRRDYPYMYAKFRCVES
jgi:iron(II)-dependent oxidoreductase